MSFSGLTPQMIAGMNNMNGNNYNTAFARSVNMIPPQNFTNTGHLMHNNMGINISTEQIEVYNIYADGSHRDKSAYPNPFKFPIEFKNYGKGVKVDRELVRTKFVRLDGIILPNASSVTYDFTDKVFTYDINDPDTSIIAKRFIVVRIDQLKDYHKFTSGNFMGDNTFVCRLDKDLGNNHSYWIPITRDTVTFKNSAPQPISKLDISVYDDDETLLEGLLLTYTRQGGGSGPETVPFDFDAMIDSIPTGSNIDPFSGSNLDADKNKTRDQINKIRKQHEIQINISIGVIENDLNINNR